MSLKLLSANHGAALAATLAARANRTGRGFCSGVYPITPSTECMEYLCLQDIEKGRAELTSIGALFSNNTAIAAFSHAVTGAFLTAGTFVACVSAWWMVRSHRNSAADHTGDGAGHHSGSTSAEDAVSMYRPATILGCLLTLTPGTLALDYRRAEGCLQIHALNARPATAVLTDIRAIELRLLAWLDAGQRPAAERKTA